MCVSGAPQLQEYIGRRMQDHFKLVERFGFGNLEELLTTAEESMSQTWVTTISLLDDDISSWPINPRRRQDPGLLVPRWLLTLGLKIMPVLRPILILARVLARVLAYIVKAVFILLLWIRPALKPILVLAHVLACIVDVVAWLAGVTFKLSLGTMNIVPQVALVGFTLFLIYGLGLGLIDLGVFMLFLGMIINIIIVTP